VDIPNARAELGPGAPASPAVIWPFLVQGQIAGAIALLNASSAPYSLRDSLESLAGQVGLALESAALTEHMLRSQSEKRFSALVKHSSDVILVLAADTTVQYASPSVMRMLERSPDELTGRRLGDHMSEDDCVHVTAAMSRLRSRPSDVSELLEFRIRHRDGRWLQTESLMTNLLDNPSVGGMVVNLRDITERKEFEEQLAYQAFHDSVTELANRALFRDRVEHALRRRSDGGRSIAVLFLDLDDFKSINDTFGHEDGDGLLRTIAGRLEGALRVGDTVARLGGDEFGILLDDVDDESQISEIAERILEVVKEPASVGDHDVSVQCSIGVAVSRASLEFAGAVDDLLRNADVAMYAAKATGGDIHRYFEAEMHESAVAERELRDDLKGAIDRDELTLAYQPMFALGSGEIHGYEALLRWHHPSRGPVSPASFISVAEQSGLILPLGRWVLERACADAVAFEQACPGGTAHALSVNISARQLQRPEIVEEVREALTSSGLEPTRLVLEVTESMMIEDLDLALSRLGALRELGVHVAVDDFGTGYSSLNYIRRLPVDILKIDKSFIDAIADDAEQEKLTGAILHLARALGLQCVAEGIEQPSQLARLIELGCDYGQGFLLAKPMDAAALCELLRDHTGSTVDA
jgi:diguanylate cyclase (GGDEF)-like protein/PAS domain S-box-containing protein